MTNNLLCPTLTKNEKDWHW